MFSIESIQKENEENFKSLVLEYHDLHQAALQLDVEYKKGKLAIFQEAKKILQKESQYKYIPFKEMITQLQNSIDDKSLSKESPSKGKLDLTGVPLKQKKKRGLQESSDNEILQENQDIKPILRMSKKEQDINQNEAK